MTKVIFLDIDGPLVNHRTCANHITPKAYGMMGKFDPIGVQMVNQLLDDFSAKLVISSTWRLTYGSHMSHVLNIAGINTNNLFDGGDKKAKSADGDNWPTYFTPKGKDVGFHKGSGRHNEIATWLDTHMSRISNFLIIDGLLLTSFHFILLVIF